VVTLNRACADDTEATRLHSPDTEQVKPPRCVIKSLFAQYGSGFCEISAASFAINCQNDRRFKPIELFKRKLLLHFGRSMNTVAVSAEAAHFGLVTLRQEYVYVTGGLTTGILLSQIVYWHKPGKNGSSKLTVMRDGRLWIAKTREKWCDETGLTLEQYKRAINLLKIHGLVELKIMKFNGQPMTHVRLCEEVLKASLDLVSGVKDITQMGLEPPSEWSLPHHSNGVIPATPYTKTKAEITAESTSCEQATLAKQQAEKSLEKRPGLRKKANLVESLKNKEKAKTAAYGDKTEVNLQSFWRQKVAEVTQELQLSMTMKDLGQLKQIRIALGDQTVSVVGYVIEQWWKFSQQVKAEDGLKSVPTRPQIWFLLKYKGIAFKMYLQSITEKTAEQAKPSPQEVAVPEPPKPASASDDDKPYKPSWEEAQAHIAEVEAAWESAKNANHGQEAHA
jgi:hypothetical protein